jgi:hypothetical protein
VEGQGATTDPMPFTFKGNISYTADHTFALTAATDKSASSTFYRAATVGAEEPWTFAELVPAGWTLSGLTCSSATGASQVKADQASAEASVRLAADDTVTCTYTDTLTPPPAGLTISKQTIGGTGSFEFTTTGAGVTKNETITTTEPEVPVEGEPLSLAPGDDEVAEKPPEPTQFGNWHLDSVICDGQEQATDGPIHLNLTSNSGAACLFTNSFVPSGQITLRKETLGGVGTAGFLIRPLVESEETWSQTATTTAPGEPTVATGDDTGHMPLGTYQVIETNPSAPAGGWWNLDSVLCNGLPTGGAQGTIEVTLTASQPTLDCTFVNQFNPGKEPANPSNPSGPPPTSPGPGAGGVKGLERASGPRAELSITKRVSPRVARPDEPLTYRIVVTNHGPGIAYNIVGTEVRTPQRHRIHLRTSGGTCTVAYPARCHLGRLLPGQSVVVTVHTRAGHPGRPTNVVAVTSSTHDPNLKDNRAKATLLVRRPKTPPRFTG